MFSWSGVAEAQEVCGARDVFVVSSSGKVQGVDVASCNAWKPPRGKLKFATRNQSRIETWRLRWILRPLTMAVVASIPACRHHARRETRRTHRMALKDDDISANPSISDERRGSGRRALLAGTAAGTLAFVELNGSGKGTSIHNPQWSCRCGGVPSRWLRSSILTPGSFRSMTLAATSRTTSSRRGWRKV